MESKSAEKEFIKLLVHASYPIIKYRNCCCSHRVFDRPVGEPRGVAEMTEIVDVAEQLVLERRKHNDRNGTVLVERSRVALQPRSEVADV